jgi:hypothetical protein
MKTIHLLFVFVRFLIDDSEDPIVRVARDLLVDIDECYIATANKE